jgi:hypothetical protein
VAHEIEFTEEFRLWWDDLSPEEQVSINRSVIVLRDRGANLGRPHVDTVKGSKYPNMKELRVQHASRPFRIFFAFNPLRTGILLIGGDKTGNKRFYDEMIPLADNLYGRHLEELDSERGGV